jgi:putative copper resistance protein D
MKLALDPAPIAGLVLAAVLYVRALGIVRRRGLRVSAWQQAAWWTGLLIEAVALLSPLSAYSDQLLSAHMGEHLLLGDVAAPFLLAGLRSPLLLFFLPRAALVTLARRKLLRRLFRLLRRPFVALPLYMAAMYGWHVASAFEGAVRDPWIHALQHQSFLVANLLLWWPVLEPQLRRMPGQLWKIGYIFAARMTTMFLGMVFVFSRGILYQGTYGTGPRRGISPFADQQTAGGMMMSLDIVIMFLALCYFFWHASQQSGAGERAEQPAVHAAT